MKCLRSRSLMILLAASVLATGCNRDGSSGGGGGGGQGGVGSGATSGTVKIISSLPRSGSANAQTTTIVNGIRLALDEVGHKVGNFKIEYEDRDDATPKAGNWDPEEEAKIASSAVAAGNVYFYIGTYNSGAAKIAMPVLNQANIIMISPANTTPGLTKPGMGEAGEPDIYRPSGKVTYFRVVPADDIQGRVGAEWVKQMGGKSVYILDDRQVYGKGIADVFDATAQEIGLKVIAHEGIDPAAQEYKSLMAKIKQADPDFIYFGGTTQTNAAQIAKDMVGAGLRAKLMVPDGTFEDAFITAAGASNANDRVFITFGGVPPEKLTGKGAEFVEKYRKKYGSNPEAYAVYGYASAKVALDALARAGTLDRETIRKAVAATEQVDGPLGTWKFDANGDTTMTQMSGNTVHNGKFEFVTLLGGK